MIAEPTSSPFPTTPHMPPSLRSAPTPASAPTSESAPTSASAPDPAGFVERHARFVRGIAKRTSAQLGLECDPRDLESFGYIGLLEARERYEADRGIPFETFAYYRVRGAIIDGVRDMAYLPRRAHARASAAAALDADTEFAAGGRMAATPADTGGALRAVDAILGRVAAAYTVAACLEGEEGDPAATPERALERKHVKARVREALRALPARERHLAEGHYIHGRRLDELSAELGLSKSWGSRLHRQALQRLREVLADHRDACPGGGMR